MPRAEAAALLTAAGDDPDTILVQAPAEQWFPTVLAALEAATGDASQAVEQHAEKYEADLLGARVAELRLLLSKVAADIGIIAREIERHEQQRAEQREIAKRQAEREALLEPIRAEHQQLTVELQQLDSWLDGELHTLRTKSSLGKRARMSDLSSTPKYKRAAEIRKRLPELAESMRAI